MTCVALVLAASALTPTAPAADAAGRLSFGAAAPDLAGLSRLEQAVGQRATQYTYYRNWAKDLSFDAGTADQVRRRGAVPEITWEPWDPARGVDQPAYTLKTIRRGDHDAYIRRWAEQVKAWGWPLRLRFAHEMNGTWYPWAEAVNGNAAGDYVAAWRHVHRLFAQAGVTNVTWVWSPNIQYAGSRPLAGLFPGDGVVDRVGLDGYNGGTALPWGGWISASALFSPTLATVRRLSRRPVVLAEVASTEQGGSKAAWISGLFAFLAANPDVTALTWFNVDKETDWRVQSSPASQRAFAQGLLRARTN